MYFKRKRQLLHEKSKLHNYSFSFKQLIHGFLKMCLENYKKRCHQKNSIFRKTMGVTSTHFSFEELQFSSKRPLLFVLRFFRFLPKNVLKKSKKITEKPQNLENVRFYLDLEGKHCHFFLKKRTV